MAKERVRRPRGEAKEAILRAASKVFNEEGTAATVDAIAAEAGYSTSALYKHFSGKDAIFDALWARLFHRLAKIFEDRPPLELPFRETVRWVYYQMMDVALDDWDFFIAVVSNRPSFQSLQDAEDDTVVESVMRIQESLVALMQRGIDEGALRSDLEPFFCQMMLDGMVRALTEIAILEQRRPSREDFDQVVDFFLAGAAPRSE